jgi:hypothetical protein
MEIADRLESFRRTYSYREIALNGMSGAIAWAASPTPQLCCSCREPLWCRIRLF